MTDILTVLGRSHAKQVLTYLGVHDQVRFSDIEHDLDLNPATVDRRPKEFVETGLVEADLGRYSITADGRDSLVTLALVSDEWPPTEHAPDQSTLLTVGSAAQATRQLQDACRGDLHRLLDSLPKEQPLETDGGVSINVTDGTKKGPEGVEADYLSLAIQYEIVPVEDNIVDTTPFGEVVLQLLEALPD